MATVDDLMKELNDIKFYYRDTRAERSEQDILKIAVQKGVWEGYPDYKQSYYRQAIPYEHEEKTENNSEEFPYILKNWDVKEIEQLSVIHKNWNEKAQLGLEKCHRLPPKR